MARSKASRIAAPPSCVAEGRGDVLVEPVVRHDAVVGGRGDDEAGRHRKSGADQLAQVRPLAAGALQVAAADLGEVQHEAVGSFRAASATADRGGRIPVVCRLPRHVAALLLSARP